MLAYCISGLGADHRVYGNLHLGKDFEIHHIKWIPPVKNEVLNSYANRLQVQIDKNEPHILIGVSFGGVIAQELAGFTNPEHVFAISSLRRPEELPWYYRMGKFQIQLTPDGLMKIPYPVLKYQFGVEGASWNLLKEIIRDQDPSFMKWALKSLLEWEGLQEIPQNLTHIHGSKDLVLKPHTPDFLIQNAGHFMIYDQAAQVAEIIRRIMADK